MTITRIRPLSFAKLSGTLYAVLGLVGGSLISLIALIGGVPPDTSGAPGIVRTLFGVGAVVVLPILYGGLGFLGTLLAAWLYNLLAGFVGGVEIDVQ